jgi:uncharacterized membrane protein (DUF4010 family)
MEAPAAAETAVQAMETVELFQRLGMALAIGLIIGIERGWREREGAPGSRTAGVRTYALMGFFGGIWAAMVPQLGPLPLALAGLGLAAAFTVYRYREAVAENDFSVTSVVVAMVTFALGAFAVLGELMTAGAAAVATTALLAARHRLHGFVRQLTWVEIRSAVLLLAMTFLFLPVLPDRAIDPWGALNPYKLWLMVIFIAAISYVGYAAVRVMGSHAGILASSAAGAMVSSTAVTLNNARLVSKTGSGNGVLAAGIAVAWAISMARQTVLACVINPVFIVPLGVPMAAAILVLALAAAYFMFMDGGKAKGIELALKNPFDLSTVLGFGALLAGVLFASKILTDVFGRAGLLPIAAITGSMDVDAITLSAAQLAATTVPAAEAALAILVAAMANMATKASTAIGIGGARFGIPLALAGIASLVTGVALWFALGGFDGV